MSTFLIVLWASRYIIAFGVVVFGVVVLASILYEKRHR